MAKSGATKRNQRISTFDRPNHLNRKETSDPNDRDKAEDHRQLSEPTTSLQLALAMPTMLYSYPPEIQRDVVTIMVACGTPFKIVATFLRIAESDFEIKYREVIKHAKAVTNGMVAGSLFNTALYGDDPRSKTTAQIFWLKAQAGWRDNGSALRQDDEKQTEAPVLTDAEYSDIEDIMRRAALRKLKAEGKVIDNPSRSRSVIEDQNALVNAGTKPKKRKR